jgi:plasmid maintenance system antidote protein VapI
MQQYQSTSEKLQEHLNCYELSPEEFAKISGMPLTEVQGLLEGRLSFTILRANHLAAAFCTKTEIWLNGQQKSPEQVRMVTEE